ncbi:MAG TPA: O-antigen ligase family protein [Candidatus Margulisiibacteriota bacterium]|nr:O-antigen ligase family protein [Candidatus Margulisiibacteriota bacterium]
MKRIINISEFLAYWAIVLVPFSITIAPGLANSFIWVMVFFFLIKKILKKENIFIHTPLNLPFLLFFTAALLSFKNTIDYGDSFRGLLKIFQNAVVFLVCAQEIKDKKHIFRIFLGITFAAAFASFDAGWQLATGADFVWGRELKTAIGLTRATAAFPNPNVFGVYISATAPIILGMALYYFKGKAKIWMLAFSVLVSFGVISTFSRGTGLAFYCAILLISIARKNKFISASLILLLLIYPFIMPQKIRDWAKKINYNPVVFMLNSDRISIYRNSFNMIKQHPILGLGVNTYCRNYSTYKLPEAAGAETAEHMYAHNNFLQMAADLGLLGLVAFCFLLFRLFRYSARNYSLLNDNYLKVLSLCVGAALMAFLINGLTETSLYYSRVAMIFWYLVGLSLGLGKFINHEDSS